MMVHKLLPFFAGILFLTVTGTQAQEGEKEYPVPYDKEKGKIIYAEVVQVKGENKTTLFDRFNDWGKKFYRNYDGKIEKKKKNAEVPVIELDGWADLEYEDGSSERIKYELKVQFKDGRYRYEFHKLHKNKGYFFGLENWIDPKTMDKEIAQKKLKKLDKTMKEIIEKMKNYMANPPQKEKSDW